MAEPKKPTKTVKRKYYDQAELNHDLYKLEIAYYKRNISYIEKQIELIDVAHNHFFHSIDSGGRPMTHCEAAGGHKHAIKTSVNENGELIATCGPALGLERNNDSHTHVVTYIKSEIVKPRKMSPEAMAEFTRQTNPLNAGEL